LYPPRPLARRAVVAVLLPPPPPGTGIVAGHLFVCADDCEERKKFRRLRAC
jgi:hypothetical protein